MLIPWVGHRLTMSSASSLCGSRLTARRNASAARDSNFASDLVFVAVFVIAVATIKIESAVGLGLM